MGYDGIKGERMSLDLRTAYAVRLNGQGKGSLEYVPCCGDCLVPINQCTHEGESSND